MINKIESNKTSYEKRVQQRTAFKFILGLGARLKVYLFLQYVLFIARRRGAQIGMNSVISLSLAKKANNNLIIGNNCSIQTDLLDLRSKISIGNNVIIGSGVEILTCSHNIDSHEWEFKSYGIEIEDYVWIATRAFILPSCTNIGYGAVCAAGAVVAKNIEKMSVVSGNPAAHIRDRKQIHKNLVVESLLGADFIAYKNTWLLRNH